MGKTDITDVLCNIGGKVQQSQSEWSKWSYLHFAALLNNPEALSYYILNGWDVNVLTSMNETPAHIACQLGHLECLKILFATERVNTSIKTTAQWTLFHTACRSGQLHIVEYLVECGLVSWDVDYAQRSPLQMSAIGGHTNVARYLVEILGANPLERSSRRPDYFAMSPVDIALHGDHSYNPKVDRIQKEYAGYMMCYAEIAQHQQCGAVRDVVCMICNENPADMVTNTCHHASCCSACAPLMTLCPFCEAHVTQSTPYEDFLLEIRNIWHKSVNGVTLCL